VGGVRVRARVTIWRGTERERGSQYANPSQQREANKRKAEREEVRHQ
jgi:hypothetical protein